MSGFTFSVSRDTVDAQHAFKVKYSLFACATVLIGANGTVEKVWPAVFVLGRAADVLACDLCVERSFSS